MPEPAEHYSTGTVTATGPGVDWLDVSLQSHLQDVAGYFGPTGQGANSTTYQSPAWQAIGCWQTNITGCQDLVTTYFLADPSAGGSQSAGERD